ncbi:MAG: hypothetical protein K2J37_04570 [Ruminococcus sp.]|nr:hypothetical protein [Ruminococcus sp.]MDE6785196.1 hypothetical protein [Ruminococcus sp.]
MKKIISLLTTGIICMGMCSLPAYAEETSGNLLSVDSTPEEILNAVISEDEEFSDGGLIYTDKYKLDVITNSSDKYYIATLVIYGFEDASQMRYDPPAQNFKDYTWICNPTEFHSGFRYWVSGRTENAKLKTDIKVLYFANNSVRDSSQRELGLIEGSRYYGFDVAPYIYPKIIAGDTDGDGMITASDASAVLEAYSMLSTGKDLILNSTIFDYNSDGLVDANDASDILAKYAELSTTRNN